MKIAWRCADHINCRQRIKWSDKPTDRRECTQHNSVRSTEKIKKINEKKTEPKWWSQQRPSTVTRMKAVKPYTITQVAIISCRRKTRTTSLNMAVGLCVCDARAAIKSVIYSRLVLTLVLMFPVYYALKWQLYALPWFSFCHFHKLFCAAENSLRATNRLCVRITHAHISFVRPILRWAAALM